MCYRVYTHSLRCDCRTFISDGRTIYNNPYAVPINCPCSPSPDIRPRLACSSHGCCMLTARNYDCADDCDMRTIYHKYTQHKPRRGKSHRSSGKPADPAWKVVPDFDIDLFPRFESFANPPTCRQESAECREAMGQLLELGNALDFLPAEIEKSRHLLWEQMQQHRREHEPCERVMNPWECEWMDDLESAKRLVVSLERLMDVYENLFKDWRQVLQLERDVDRIVRELKQRKGVPRVSPGLSKY